ncbi:MAG: YCF48-related protein [Candidatus Poribacteria bacterium]|nr:YCF48-related protein [Candidatus Poribacteria bacterium]
MQKKNYLTLMMLCGSLVYFGCSEDSAQFEWRQIESGTDTHLYGVHFVDAKRGWAVGTAGTVLSTTDSGTTWQSSSVSKDALTQVNFTTPNNGWLASIGQVHYTASGGATWNVQHQIRSQSRPPGILDLHFVSKTEGWAVGGKGTVLWTENGGGRWENIQDLSDKHLWGVHFVDPQRGWIVGEEGEVLHTQDGGKRWVRQNSGAEQPLFAVHFASQTHGWIVGTNGLILHSANGGRTWLRQRSPINENLRDVAFHDATSGWAVGEKGLILRTEDSGRTWHRYSSPARHNLQDIYLNKNAGWIVGAKGTVLRSY